MNKLIKLYINTYHSSIHMKPIEMTPAIEIEYITKCIKHSDYQKRINDFKLRTGSYVRCINHKGFGKKRRTQYSPEKYIIKGKSGGKYVIQAANGSTKTVSRYELVACNDDRVPFGKTFA